MKNPDLSYYDNDHTPPVKEFAYSKELASEILEGKLPEPDTNFYDEATGVDTWCYSVPLITLLTKEF